MQVEVRPIPSRQPEWLSHLKPQESIQRPITIEAVVNLRENRYETGLTPEEEAKYSAELGIDLSSKLKFVNGNVTSHPYYHNRIGRVKLENRTMLFNMDNPSDVVKVKLMKASQFVANSLDEIDDYPEATHYIYNEDEQVKERYKKIAINDACSVEKNKLTPTEKANIVFVLGGKYVIGKSSEYIDVALNEIIETKPQEFLGVARMDKKNIADRATVLDAIRRGILNRDGFAINYMGTQLANNVDEMVEYIQQPENQKIKLAILEKLK